MSKKRKMCVFIAVFISIIYIARVVYVNANYDKPHEYIYDKESKFLILMYLYEENRNRGNIKVGLKYFKLAAEAYPEMSDFLAEYIKSDYL